MKGFKFICLFFLLFFFSHHVALAATNGMAEAIYSYAHSGNLSQLYKFSNYIDTTDDRGNSALCRSVYNQDYSAFYLLKKVGANPQHPCVGRIPRNVLSNFNQGYTNWARNVNRGSINPSWYKSGAAISETSGLKIATGVAVHQYNTI